MFKVNSLKKYQDFLQRLTASHHAIILHCDDEILLDTIAKLFVMKCECDDKHSPCMICTKCQKIIDCNALDVEYFGEEKSILVDDSEKIVEDSFVLPLEFKNKYFVLKDFDKATTQAQNKLLKVIEEPKQFDKFVLLTTNLSAVLSTIKSRCEIFSVPRFNEKELLEVFDYQVGEGRKVNFSTEYANGSLTKLNAIYNDEDFEDLFEICKKIVSNMQNSSQVLEYSALVLKYKSKIQMFLEILQSLYKDMLLVKLGKTSFVQNKDFMNGLLVLSNGVNQLAITKILEEIQSINQKLIYNANINGVVDNLLLKILEIKFLCK